VIRSGSGNHSPTRHTAPRCRPGLEVLDGRTLPSSVTGLHIVTSPTVNNNPSLNAVSEDASNDVWAVGSFVNPIPGFKSTLTPHRKGDITNKSAHKM
jgi:hypothetical protein